MERRHESKQCKVCGETFMALILYDGEKLVYTATSCENCAEKERKAAFAESRAKRIAGLAQEAEARSDNLRCEWAACLPLRYIGARFAGFDKSLQSKAYAVLSTYNLWPDEGVASSVVLLSPKLYGVGKTHLVCALIQHLIDTSVPCKVVEERETVRCGNSPAFFITEPDLLSRIRASFNPRYDDSETEEQIYRKLGQYELLSIDDVGKTQPKDPSFLQGVYYRIIDGRYTAGKPIMLTSNLDYAAFERHIGGACADRLVEMCGDNIIKMTGKSYRGK